MDILTEITIRTIAFTDNKGGTTESVRELNFCVPASRIHTHYAALLLPDMSKSVAGAISATADEAIKAEEARVANLPTEPPEPEFPSFDHEVKAS